MIREKSDYTRTFRLLSHSEQHSAASPLRDEFIDRAAFDSWFAGYRARLRDERVDDAQRQQRMQGVNPALVLRNWLAQRAIEQAEAGDMGELERLRAALAAPLPIARTTTSAARRTGGVWKSAARANAPRPRSAGRYLVRINFPAWVWRSNSAGRHAQSLLVLRCLTEPDC
jgi:uncharacterized protein YdiU (UPF0061 family)